MQGGDWDVNNSMYMPPPQPERVEGPPTAEEDQEMRRNEAYW